MPRISRGRYTIFFSRTSVAVVAAAGSAPAYVDSGAGAAIDASNGDGTWGGGGGGPELNASCPATVNAGDFLIAHVVVRAASANPTINSVVAGGWTQEYHDTSANITQAVFYKIADGTEDGATVAFAGTNPDGEGGFGAFARVHRISGVALAAMFESGGGLTGTDTSIEYIDVVTGGDNRLFCLFIGVSDDNVVGDVSGESGAAIAKAVADYTTTTGGDATLSFQIATVATGGTTVTGGSASNAAVDPWVSRSFALKPL
jgi:hypothetical protein